MRYTLIFMLLSIVATAQKTSSGTVARVIDGDTYLVDVDSYRGNEATIRVRLINVDCPEMYFIPKRRPAQPYGNQAQRNVEHLIGGRKVDLTYYGKDRYGRVLAFVKVDGQRLDDILLSKGWAWPSKEYHLKKDYKNGKLQSDKAKSQRIGLWADPDPIAPWIWRKSTITDKLLKDIAPYNPVPLSHTKY